MVKASKGRYTTNSAKHKSKSKEGEVATTIVIRLPLQEAVIEVD